jgi:hypothetical protein
MAAMPKHATPWESEIARLEGVAEALEGAVAGHADFCCCHPCSARRGVGTALLYLYAIADGSEADVLKLLPPDPPAPAKPKPPAKAPAPKPPAKGSGPYGADGGRR